jgi:hypothetical protein
MMAAILQKRETTLLECQQWVASLNELVTTGAINNHQRNEYIYAEIQHGMHGTDVEAYLFDQSQGS